MISNGSTYLQRARSVPAELTIGSFAESEGASPQEFTALINELLQDSQTEGRLQSSAAAGERGDAFVPGA